jgi:hypothetical protein
MAKFNEATKQIGSCLLILLIVIAVYVLSWFTGGPLTTARSCTGSYIIGESSLENVRSDCSSLTKENFISQVNEHFDQFGDKNAFTSREKMIREIEQNY